MRSALMHLTLGGPLVVLAMISMLSPHLARSAPDGISLLLTLARWQYPGSEIHGGASMSDGGNPQIQSVKCAAILTTPDPVEKVVAFYAKKFGAVEPAGPRPAREDVKVSDAKSVIVQDDSNGRPLSLRVIVVNNADTSTTLVISRADGEKETHIAWAHYIRLDARQVQAAAAPIRFSLGIYSGREDPIWEASDEEARAFTARFDAMKVKVPKEPLTGGLGYHGFWVKGFRSYDRIWVWNGRVEATRDGKTYHWDDEGRTLEKFLLAASKSHVSDREYNMADAAVEEK